MELADGGAVRLIVEDEQDGRWNMAVDEALLEAVTTGESRPVLRLYGFAPPTLSVGRFQPTAGRLAFDRLERDGVLFVRRPSGGQAVLHTDELTYAIVLGKDHLAPFGKRNVYRFAARLLLSALAKVGVGAARLSQGERGNPMNPDCFGSSGEYEIDSASGLKLVGSAQMVSRSAVLQHGSIPLSPANRRIQRYLLAEGGGETSAGNIESELGAYRDFATVRAAFAEAFRDALRTETDSLMAGERRRAQALYETKYSEDAWNRRE